MPFPGSTFKVNANEFSLGPGIVTVLEGGFLFEAKDQRHIGFDFNLMRLVRVTDINSFDVAYSLQGSIQRATFVTTPRYVRKNEGIEKDVTTNPLDWTLSFWKLHTITGAVAARVLIDRAGAQSEGLSLLTDSEFELEFRRAYDDITKLPSMDEIETGKITVQEVNNLERQLSSIFLRLSDSWLLGKLSSIQRTRTAALHYLDYSKRYELGWYNAVPSEFSSEMSRQDYKENAENWLTEEKIWGSNLQEITSN